VGVARGQGDVVLFIGTSLTAGLGLAPDSAYPQLIQQKIDSAALPFAVTNAGLSGETTAGLLRRLDWLMRGNFDVVLVESGANDGLRGTPVEAVKENLHAILSRIRTEHPKARVLLVQMEAPPNLGPEYTNAFHALFGEVAKETGATLIPFLLQGVAGDRNLNQADGIHPNQRGEHIVADNVWKSLSPVLRQVATGL
jgi:acyl-CoA thioesterase-1